MGQAVARSMLGLDPAKAILDRFRENDLVAKGFVAKMMHQRRRFPAAGGKGGQRLRRPGWLGRTRSGQDFLQLRRNLIMSLLPLLLHNALTQGIQFPGIVPLDGDKKALEQSAFHH